MSGGTVHDDDPTDRSDLVEVGRVVKPHGLRGEVAVHLLTDRPDVRFAVDAAVVVDAERRTVASSRPHQGRWLVRFADVADRDAAERLRGAALLAGPLPGDDQTDAFWVHELVGMAVLTEDGDDLGDVVAVVELPAAAGYDLLEVAHPDRDDSWWLPAADDLVEAVETDDGDTVLVVVDPPAGLWDDDQRVALQPGDEVERELDSPPADG